MSPAVCDHCGRPIVDGKFEWFQVKVGKTVRVDAVCPVCADAWRNEDGSLGVVSDE